MEQINETQRDREYLRALFFLGAHEEPVGPSKLSELMGISRAGALQKNRRIEKLGYGKYIENKGILLNEKAVESIKKDISKHHAIETFFKKSLGMDAKEACEESSKIENHVSSRLLQKIYDELEDELDCECGKCIDPNVDSDPDDLYDCHWYKKRFSILESTD